MMFHGLLISGGMAVATIIIHMAGLALLLAVMRERAQRFRPDRGPIKQSIFIIGVVLGLFVIHAIEITAYAGLYKALGLFGDWEEALYFSVTTFTTLGVGDIVLEKPWRIVAALESFNGFLLIGWSTAFLVSVIGRLRAIEFEWMDHLRDGDGEEDEAG